MNRNPEKNLMRDFAGVRFIDFCLGLMGQVRQFVQPAFDAQGEQIRRLQERLAEIEAKQISFRGVWQRGENYQKNDLVMRSGSAFVAVGSNCNYDPTKQLDERAWRMVVQGSRPVPRHLRVD